MVRRSLSPKVELFLGAWIAYQLTEDNAWSAFGATVGSYLSYYCVVIPTDLISDWKKARNIEDCYGLEGMVKTVRNITYEFGPFSLLDLFCSRPLLTFGANELLGPEAGTLVGSLSADTLFYGGTYTLHRAIKKKE
jgi:hypothetical protein